MPEFGPLARYRPGPAVKARQANNATVVRLRNAAGDVIDQLDVLPGEWVVIADGDARTERPEAFADGFDPLPWAPGYFVAKAPVRQLRQPLDGADADAFRETMMRCAGDGSLLCPSAASLSVQAEMLTAAPDAEAAREHMAVLRVLHTRTAAQFVFDPAVQADLHTFNVLAGNAIEFWPRSAGQFWPTPRP
jgi:hypothetical protein